jgi:NAD+ synthase (glutamine-hydrolysing)
MSLSREGDGIDLHLRPTRPKEVSYYLPEEEIAYGPACYLWDYLRRAKQAGFFLPLSGGIDSCATALIVHSMTRLVLEAIQSGKNPQVLQDLHRICGEEENSTWKPKTPQEICNKIFCTAYMAMEKHSSSLTRCVTSAYFGRSISLIERTFGRDYADSEILKTTSCRFG